MPNLQFQSLSGFQVRCNIRTFEIAVIEEYLFQSLSGFQVRCNPWGSDEEEETKSCFNPYRVFKFAATYRKEALERLQEEVSIPIGFSSSLQLC